ncbi:MAG: hypothetical protein ACLFSM_03660 [Thermoplasmata archaeon]
MCELIIYLLLLLSVLIVYAGLMTYLYLKEKSKREEVNGYDNDIDLKIQEIGERLEEIKK